jgi:hypothetical protein
MQGYQDALRIADEVRARAETSLNMPSPPTRPRVEDPAFPKSEATVAKESGIVLSNGVLKVVVDPERAAASHR